MPDIQTKGGVGFRVSDLNLGFRVGVEASWFRARGLELEFRAGGLLLSDGGSLDPELPTDAEVGGLGWFAISAFVGIGFSRWRAAIASY